MKITRNSISHCLFGQSRCLQPFFQKNCLPKTILKKHFKMPAWLFATAIGKINTNDGELRYLGSNKNAHELIELKLKILRALLFTWMSLFFLLPNFSIAGDTIRYPLHPGYTREIEEQGYFVQALQLALQKAGTQHTALPSRIGMMHERSLRELEVDSGLVDVIWSYSSRELEDRLLPIKIPIDKGLVGWRLLFVRKSELAKFTNVNSVNDLKGLKAVQGHDWLDKKILEENGMVTYGGVHFQNMFSMLQLGRVDMFPRSVIEIWDEQNDRQSNDVVIEPTLILHYPSAIFFWVNKNNLALQQILASGLDAAMRDGSMDKLFDDHFGKSLSKANLARRKVIELKNPFITQSVQPENLTRSLGAKNQKP